MSQETGQPTMPSELLRAISSPQGGRVVLVLGAGCSYEEPTALPLSGDLSKRCYRKLVDDGVLTCGDVDNPYDLSAVAKAVVRKRDSQRELIERFPPGDFRQAEPNEGYLIMAALLLEGALADTLTLNFDHAARSALSRIGARNEVATITGPDGHDRISNRNLIYLHRDIDSQPDDLILRRCQLDQAWQEGWEQVVAQRVLAGPVTVFIGLGSPASVLVETMNRIMNALPENQANVFVVDTVAYDDSTTALELNVDEDAYLRMGWGDFMRALAHRVVREHCAELQIVCEGMVDELGIESEDVSDLCERLANVGLIGLGQLRASWMLREGSYMAKPNNDSLNHFGDILMGVRLLERLSGSRAQFFKEGLVEFTRGANVTQVIACSGAGWRNYASIQAKLSWRFRNLRREGRAPTVAMVAGVTSGPEVATPIDITVDTNSDDLVIGPPQLRVVSIDELRNDPERVKEMIQ